MNLEPGFNGFSAPINGYHFQNRPVPFLPNQNLAPVPRFENACIDFSRPDAPPTNALPTNSNLIRQDDLPATTEDCDFSDVILGYINQMLMEEEVDDKPCMLQESLDLQAAERSFYEAIGKRYPPSPESSNYIDIGTLEYDRFGDLIGDRFDDGYLVDSSRVQNLSNYSVNTNEIQTVPFSVSSSSSNSIVNSGVDGLVDSPNSAPRVPDLNRESESVWLFRRGVEEATRFLPPDKDLLVDFQFNGSCSDELSFKLDTEEDKECSITGLIGRKNSHREDLELDDERSRKLAAVYPDDVLRSALFDKILVHVPGEESMNEFNALRNVLRNGVRKNLKNLQPNVRRGRGANGVKGRGKKQSAKKEVVDLRTLLIHCAQAVAADDRRTANELIKKIRQNSSPFGEGNQRLAHYIANGLEARVAGTGSQIYKGLACKRTSASDILKAYNLYLAACPFRKLSNFISNKSFLALAKNSTRLHVIDFGILYGFQWPTLIQRLSRRDGGPPNLKITGIEFPQPGFRPAERVEETGRRLAAYADEFRVPFEYNAIAKKWDTIQLEELNIRQDEIVVVNCLYRSENLPDETVAVDNSRDAVLKFIRKINPDLFIHGIVNGAYNAPFFVTRFREALFHFSAMFDMLETIVPREDHERMLIERELFGREALNVIACEGWERTERPETYKQWQVRNLRAGFMQVLLNRDILKEATERVSSGYHKDFVIDADGKWVLQGWKGRTIFALSAWKPA